MNVIIPIKQVPETNNVKMDENTGTMIREGIESIINPLDLYAIEVGIQLKEQYGGRVTVISMGPLKAEEALKEAIAMGCDDGILLSHKAFAGADTLSTSYVLSKSIRKIGKFDLILCGERATDGDTGQVGPGIASFLNIPLATYVSKIRSFSAESEMIVERMVEDGYEILSMPLPALFTVVKEISYPRLPTLRGKQRAKKIEIPVYGPDEIQADSRYLGLKGSPTRVVRIFRPQVNREGEMIVVKDENTLNYAVDKLVEFLQSKEFVN